MSDPPNGAKPAPNVEHFTNAREFLNALRRTDERWLGPQERGCGWIFRGHWNADWPLHPSILRPSLREHPLYKREACKITQAGVEAWVKGNAQWPEPKASIPLERVREFLIRRVVEFNATIDFAVYADRLGLDVPIPRVYPRFSNEVLLDPAYEFVLVEEHTRSGPFGLPPFARAEVEVCFAVAKHHGVPSRLMDWSFNPLVAAFFAADCDAESSQANDSPQQEETSMAVWALNMRDEMRRVGPWIPRVRFAFAPHSRVRFAQAQGGVFTLIDEGDCHYLRSGDWPTLDQAVESANLKKLTLPHSQADGLLRLLEVEEITRACLMPTHDNVCKSLDSAWRTS